MSEEQVTQEEGTWSGLKKTLIGTVATVITGAGAWVGTTLFGGGDDAQPAQQAAPPSIIINNTQQQQQAAGGGKTIVIKEKAAAPAPAETKPAPKKDDWAKEEPKW